MLGSACCSDPRSKDTLLDDNRKGKHAQAKLDDLRKQLLRVPQRVVERDQRVHELEAEVALLRASHCDAESRAQADPAHPSAAARDALLAQAHSNAALLEAHNAQLSALLVDREKMISDLLVSSAYRREVLVKKEAALTPEERQRIKAQKKSAVCAMM